MSDEVFQQSDSLLDNPAVGTDIPSRLGGIVGLAAAFALVANFVVGMWALVVLVEALA